MFPSEAATCPAGVGGTQTSGRGLEGVSVGEGRHAEISSTAGREVGHDSKRRVVWWVLEPWLPQPLHRIWVRTRRDPCSMPGRWDLRCCSFLLPGKNMSPSLQRCPCPLLPRQNLLC